MIASTTIQIFVVLIVSLNVHSLNPNFQPKEHLQRHNRRHYTHSIHEKLFDFDIDKKQSAQELDQKILKIAGPAILNFAIIPLVGAVDTYWIGRMRNALALAGSGAANQVFSSAFWIISFIPNVVTPQVAKASGKGDIKAVQDRIAEALFIGVILGSIGMTLLTLFTNPILSSVLPGATSVVKTQYASPYLRIRGFTFIPALITTIGLAGFRGTMDVTTPLKISLFSNLINLVLDPILMFTFNMGITGAALATCISEVVSCVLYVILLINKGLLDVTKIFHVPALSALLPLITSGLTVQLRAIALNLAILAVTRTTQTLDTTGVSAAAHAITIQLWQLTGTILLAMSSVASTVLPNEIAKARQFALSSSNPELAKQSKKYSLVVGKFTGDRLLYWGIVLGFSLCLLQLMSQPLLAVFTPLKEVQQQAKLPSLIGAALQTINGIVFIGEGIQLGNQCFGTLAASTMFATVGMLTSLHFFGKSLIGVWASFGVFNFIRLIGVLRHHFIDGPLSPKNINKLDVQATQIPVAV